MTLLFLLGCAEPGADGVGDYTRRLAGEMLRKGYRVLLVATHDCVAEAAREEQAVSDTSVPVVRIPRGWNDHERFALLTDVLKQETVDWVSVQYVPYAFQPRGLPYLFTGRLAQILAPYRTQVMFHECWVGISRTSPLKHRLIGPLQAYVARRMIRIMAPEWVTTSNELYQRVLKRGGIRAGLLPLFSNIPFAPFPAPSTKKDVKPSVANFLEEAPARLRNRSLVCGVFGTIYPETNLGEELKRLLAQAQHDDRELLLVAFGRSGKTGTARLDEIEAAFGTDLRVIRLGELGAASISAVMQCLDVSISCTPRQHLGKSGVFAALRRHGVRVIANVDEEIPEYTDLVEAAVDRLYARPPESWGVEWVAAISATELRKKSVGCSLTP